MKEGTRKTPVIELLKYMKENQYFIGDDLLKEFQSAIEVEKDFISNAYFEAVNKYYGINQHNLEEITEDIEEYYKYLTE